MVVATGIANIYGRDAVAANAASRTLCAAFPGRFLLGLGVSHAPLVERMRGHSYGKPVQAMREYLDAMDGAPYLVADGQEPAPRVLAALGPKMLELARDRTQGAHPYLVTPEHTAQARELLGPDAVLAVEQAVVLERRRRGVPPARPRPPRDLHGPAELPEQLVPPGFTEEDAVRGGSDRLKAALVIRGLDAAVARVREHQQPRVRATSACRCWGRSRRPSLGRTGGTLAEALL